LVSRSARMIEVESACTMRLVPAQNGIPTDLSVVLRSRERPDPLILEPLLRLIADR
jgi:hypothetical protein